MEGKYCIQYVCEVARCCIVHLKQNGMVCGALDMRVCVCVWV